MENDSENSDEAVESEAVKKISGKINPFLEHLNIENIEIDNLSLMRMMYSIDKYTKSSQRVILNLVQFRVNNEIEEDRKDDEK